MTISEISYTLAYVLQVIELLGDGQYNVPSILTGQYHLEGGKDSYFDVFGHSSRSMEYPHYQVSLFDNLEQFFIILDIFI